MATIPDEEWYEVVVEIPQGSRNKYEIDHETGEIWLVVLAVLCSAIAAYYYLRVLVFLYMKEPLNQGSAPALVFSKGAAVTLALTVAFVLKLGIMPEKALGILNELFKTKPQSTASLPPR